MDFKKVFIENESISGELQDAINSVLSREFRLLKTRSLPKILNRVGNFLNNQQKLLK